MDPEKDSFRVQGEAMKDKFLILFCCCFLAFTMSAWAQQGLSVKPKYEVEQVIVKARDLAVEEGLSLEKYFIERVEYDWSNKEWRVFFQGRIPPGPGSDAFVILDEKTDEIKFYVGE